MSNFWYNIAALPSSFHTGLAFLFGLLVGSFLNVVIYRYPKLLKFQWTQQSHQWLHQTEYTAETPPGLMKPASYCFKCKNPLRFWHNIPLISYLVLRGRCAYCKTKVSVRYPLVELITGLLSAYMVYHFAWSWQALLSVFLIWGLVALFFIDLDHQLLPDDIVLPMMWLGLLISLASIFATPNDAILGAVAGYLSFWLIFQLFKLLTGKEGMGHGDFKLLAVFGAWLGWQMLPLIILLSTAIGSVFGIYLMLFKKSKASQAIPFGPYIIIAGCIALIWGESINRFYLGLSL